MQKNDNTIHIIADDRERTTAKMATIKIIGGNMKAKGSRKI